MVQSVGLQCTTDVAKAAKLKMRDDLGRADHPVQAGG